MVYPASARFTSSLQETTAVVYRAREALAIAASLAQSARGSRGNGKKARVRRDPRRDLRDHRDRHRRQRRGDRGPHGHRSRQHGSQAVLTAKGPRVALVGCGHWGANLARNLAQMGSLGLICDSSLAARRRAAKDHPRVRSTPFDARSRRPGLLGGAIAAPPEDHIPIARHARSPGRTSSWRSPALSRASAFLEPRCCAADSHGRHQSTTIQPS